MKKVAVLIVLVLGGIGTVYLFHRFPPKNGKMGQLQREESPARENKALRLSLKEARKESKNEEYGYRCLGTTDLPDDALLVVDFIHRSMVAPSTFRQQTVLVKDGKFEAFLGPFSKPLCPGPYSIQVFFSPQMQPKKIQAHFAKSILSLEEGEKTEYQTIFLQETQEVEKIFEGIEMLYLLTCRDYKMAQKMGKLQYWHHGSERRQKELGRLRDLEEKARTRYLCPFYHLPFQYLFQLLNVLDYLEDRCEEALQEGEESFLKDRFTQFKNLHGEAWAHFRHEMVALAPDGIHALRLEIEGQEKKWAALEARKKNEEPSDLFGSHSRLKKWVDILLLIQHLEISLRNASRSSQNFKEQSNSWFMEIRKLGNEMEARFMDEQNQSLLSPPAEWQGHAPLSLYSLLLSLLDEWREKGAGLGILSQRENRGPVKRFAPLWQEMVQEIHHKKIFAMLYKENLEWFKQSLVRLKEEIAGKEEDLEAATEKIGSHNLQVLERQQTLGQLYQVMKSPDPEDRRRMEEYHLLCALSIAFVQDFSLKKDLDLQPILERIESMKNR